MAGVRFGGRAAAFAVAVVQIVTIARPAVAQSCDTSCPLRLRDARGCCPANGPVQPAPSPPRPEPAAPRRTPKSSGGTCPPGQETSVDTAGHCCWPGQAWAGARCVGAPTFCPSGFVADKDTQACELLACTDGKQRTSDGVHCCFAGQAWSSREVCVGTPSCPAGMEPDGESCRSNDLDNDGVPNASDKCPQEPEDKDGFEDEDGCPDPDNDKDGILDGVDKCPLEPEDKNNYQDDDGCPDERERAAVVAARERAEAARAKEAAREQEEADRKKREAEAIEARAEYERDVASQKTLGYMGIVVGAGAVVGGVIFLLVASSTQSSIAAGGYATGDDIGAAKGRLGLFNAFGDGLVILGGASAIAGTIALLALPKAKTDKDPRAAFAPRFQGGRLVW